MSGPRKTHTSDAAYNTAIALFNALDKDDHWKTLSSRELFTKRQLILDYFAKSSHEGDKTWAKELMYRWWYLRSMDEFLQNPGASPDKAAFFSKTHVFAHDQKQHEPFASSTHLMSFMQSEHANALGCIEKFVSTPEGRKTAFQIINDWSRTNYDAETLGFHALTLGAQKGLAANVRQLLRSFAKEVKNPGEVAKLINLPNGQGANQQLSREGSTALMLAIHPAASIETLDAILEHEGVDWARKLPWSRRPLQGCSALYFAINLERSKLANSEKANAIIQKLIEYIVRHPLPGVNTEAYLSKEILPFAKEIKHEFAQKCIETALKTLATIPVSLKTSAAKVEEKGLSSNGSGSRSQTESPPLSVPAPLVHKPVAQIQPSEDKRGTKRKSTVDLEDMIKDIVNSVGDDADTLDQASKMLSAASVQLEQRAKRRREDKELNESNGKDEKSKQDEKKLPPAVTPKALTTPAASHLTQGQLPKMFFLPMFMLPPAPSTANQLQTNGQLGSSAMDASTDATAEVTNPFSLAG